MVGDTFVAEEQVKNSTRIVWIDIAKALLIYLCVFGHIDRYGSKASTLVFAFHMPAFFILSGYVLNCSRPFRTFLIKNIISSLVPYSVFCCLFTIVQLCTGHVELFNKQLLYQVFFSNQPDLLWIGAGWFLVALFWARLASYTFNRFVEEKRVPVFMQVLLLFILYYIASHILQILNAGVHSSRLPAKLDSALMAFCIVQVGFFLKKMKLEINPYVAFCVLGIIFYFVGLSNGWCNVADCIYYDCGLYFIESMSGSLCVFAFSKVLAKTKLARPFKDMVNK